MNAAAPRYTDVSLTDGQSARWSGAMSTPMMLAVASRIAATKPAAIEVLSHAVLSQCMTRGENPWQRVALLRERCAGVALRVAISLLNEHGHQGSDVMPVEMAVLWLRELKRCGVSEIVLIDPVPAGGRMAPVLAHAKALGVTAIAALPFVDEARHSDESLAAQAALLAQAGAARIMLRDEAGLLTVDRLSTLLPALRAGLGATPLDLHLRCQTALGPQVALEAVRLGIDGLDTAFAPLANGASVPALGTLLKSLRMLGVAAPATEQELHAVRTAEQMLTELADRHGFENGTAWVFDLAPYAHQLPGELAAHFMRELAEAGLSHALHAYATECARIRADVGSPPMLPPYARPIAEQAMLHLQGLPSYSELRPGLRRALQQVYGPSPCPPDGRLLQRIGVLPAMQPRTVEQLRSAWPTAGNTDLLTAHATGTSADAQPAPATADALSYDATTPADALLAGLTARAPRYAQLAVHGPGVAIQLHSTEG
jgi:oxaloacetate decarboxylase alpha subunit